MNDLNIDTLDILCVCGHSKSFHHFFKQGDGYCLGTDCFDCFNYKPDNLSYIELLAKQKGLV